MNSSKLETSWFCSFARDQQLPQPRPRPQALPLLPLPSKLKLRLPPPPSDEKDDSSSSNNDGLNVGATWMLMLSLSLLTWPRFASICQSSSSSSSSSLSSLPDVRCLCVQFFYYYCLPACLLTGASPLAVAVCGFASANFAGRYYHSRANLGNTIAKLMASKWPEFELLAKVL